MPASARERPELVTLREDDGTPRPGDVEIRGAMIRLGQLLKLAGIVDSGAEAKLLLGREEVAVNGRPERRRGRQLRGGDRVRVGSEELCVRASEGCGGLRGPLEG